MSKLVALLPNSMQIAHNWSEKVYKTGMLAETDMIYCGHDLLGRLK